MKNGVRLIAMRLFYDIVADKRDGRELHADDLAFLADGYLSGGVTDYQMAAFLMAVCIRGMTARELRTWTDKMLFSGTVFSFPDDGRPVVDKHSTGGVGDKISIPLAPLLAALGFRVPMISGRGLGHTGGTLDKLEAIPGFRVGLDSDGFLRQVQDVGVAMIGQTAEIVPLDRKLYALRDVTGTVESVPLIASSIMSKKLAEGIAGLLLDVKTGEGAFMRRLTEARLLGKTMKEIGEQFGKKMVVLVTRMDEPLGRAAGHTVEIAESLAVLRGEEVPQVSDLVVRQAAELLMLFGRAKSLKEGTAQARRKLVDGSALAVFRRMVVAQGGDPRALEDSALLPVAPLVSEVVAPYDGFVSRIGARACGKALVLLGGGRMRKEDAIDHTVALTFPRKVGEAVVKGEPIVRVYCRDASRLLPAIEVLKSAVEVSVERPAAAKLIAGRL